MNHRRSRVAALIVRHITEIIQFELKNPNIGMVTITEGKVSSDNEFVKIYVSFFGAENPKARLEELQKSKGFIRTELAHRLTTYKTPDIVFVYDDTAERAARLTAALKKDEEWLNKK